VAYEIIVGVNDSFVTSEPIDWRYKAFMDPARSISDAEGLGWNALDGDFTFPVLVLKGSALRHNIDLMQAYCREHDVSLAPHAKTPLSPQIARWQMAAGAWGLTAATFHQVRVLRMAGTGRIVMANQLLENRPLAWIAEELVKDPTFEFICLVDSHKGVELMESHLANSEIARSNRQLSVLLEMGVPGGRTGCRSVEQARALGARLLESPLLRLVGVEAYENVFDFTDFQGSIGRVDEMLDTTRMLVELLNDDLSFANLDEVIVSAGGSIYFDRVIDRLTHWNLTVPVRVVLRSGAYVTQDGAYYGEYSPLGDRGNPPDRLRQAMELWAMVLSRPEEGLVVLGMGKRDVGHDRGLPTPFAVRSEGQLRPPGGLKVTSLNDHHARCTIGNGERLEPGDLVGLQISHPCTTFDKWRLIPLVDDDYRLVDVIRTYL
jgi:D-serine dehydratase